MMWENTQTNREELHWLIQSCDAPWVLPARCERKSDIEGLTIKLLGLVE